MTVEYKHKTITPKANTATQDAKLARVSFYSFTSLLYWLVIGLFATFSMDLWGLALQFTLHIPHPTYAPIGRLISDIFNLHNYFANTSSKHALFIQERLGWYAHIAMGLFYAALFMIIKFKVLNAKPRFLSCLFFAWVMIFVPFLIEQPALGLGFAASHMTHPDIKRFMTLSYHTVFGIGLFIGACIICIVSKFCCFYSIAKYCHWDSVSP